MIISFHPVWTSQLLTMIDFLPDSTVTLENRPNLHKMTAKAPYTGMLAYFKEQARPVGTVRSPFLGQIAFLGTWNDTRIDGTIGWLEPAKWEMFDRELCSLMGRSDEKVKLEVVPADLELSDRNGGTGCERADSTTTRLLNGVSTRGGVVKIQRVRVMCLNFVLLPLSICFLYSMTLDSRS
jgi:hypothetical protein